MCFSKNLLLSVALYQYCDTEQLNVLYRYLDLLTPERGIAIFFFKLSFSGKRCGVGSALISATGAFGTDRFTFTSSNGFYKGQWTDNLR